MPALKFPKSWLRTLGYRQKIHHFFFSHKWGTRFKYLSKLCPYILMYSALHIMQWFSQVFDVFTPKIKRKFLIFTFYESKQMSLTQDLRWSLGRSIPLQLQRQTDLLLCTINCFLQWDHPPNMAVGDLAFYYTLYLWSDCVGTQSPPLFFLKIVFVPPTENFWICPRKCTFCWKPVYNFAVSFCHQKYIMSQPVSILI